MMLMTMMMVMHNVHVVREEIMVAEVVMALMCYQGTVLILHGLSLDEHRYL